MWQIRYVDDYGRKHLSFVGTIEDLKFYCRRFDVISFSRVSKNI